MIHFDTYMYIKSCLCLCQVCMLCQTLLFDTLAKWVVSYDSYATVGKAVLVKFVESFLQYPCLNSQCIFSCFLSKLLYRFKLSTKLFSFPTFLWFLVKFFTCQKKKKLIVTFLSYSVCAYFVLPYLFFVYYYYYYFLGWPPGMGGEGGRGCVGDEGVGWKL